MLSIRTQDRMALVPYDSCIGIYENCTNEVEIILQNYTKHPKDIEKIYEYALIVGEIKLGLRLGTYATKERALEVLDEIENAVCDNQNMFDEYVSSDYGGYNKRGVVKTVYQMPKE